MKDPNSVVQILLCFHVKEISRQNASSLLGQPCRLLVTVQNCSSLFEAGFRHRGNRNLFQLIHISFDLLQPENWSVTFDFTKSYE